MLDLLYPHQHIDIYGSGNSLLQPWVFNIRWCVFQRCQFKNFTWWTGLLCHIIPILTYCDDYFLFRRKTNENIQIAQTLKENNTPIIVLTSVGDNHLSHYADYIFKYWISRERFYEIAPFASNFWISLMSFSLVFFKRLWTEYSKIKLVTW